MERKLNVFLETIPQDWSRIEQNTWVCKTDKLFLLYKEDTIKRVPGTSLIQYRCNLLYDSKVLESFLLEEMNMEGEIDISPVFENDEMIDCLEDENYGFDVGIHVAFILENSR